MGGERETGGRFFPGGLPLHREATYRSPGTNRDECFLFVIILIKVIYTRENPHIVLFLPTVRFPSQRQALLPGSEVFWG